MKNLFLLLLVFVQFTVIGQKQVKNANKAFQKESYIAASKIYEDVVNSGDVTPELLRNLGDSYYYNARYAEAAPWYAKLFQLSSDQPAEYYYRYAQALKSAQQAVRADSVMTVFCAKFPTEIRTKNYLVKQNYFLENSPFSAIHLKNLEINTAYSDYGATIHGDSIYFASARPEILDPEEYERTQQPFTNLFVAKFIDTNVFRSKLYDNGKIFSVFHESTPTFSADGKTMYYTKNELASKKSKTLVNGRYRLYKSVYENGKWVNKGLVNIKTNDSCRIAHPALSPDNKRLYFASDMKGTYGQSDIYYVDLYDNDSVSLPVNLGTKVNTEGRDSYPFISQDNHLYFASEGHPGFGGFDVFMLDLSDNSSAVKHLDSPINSTSDDFAFVSKMNDKRKQTNYVLTSNRPGGQGDDDIYSWIIPYKTVPETPFMLAGKVKDSLLLTDLAGVLVTLRDDNNQVIATTTTDSQGNYQFPVEKGTNYALVFSKDNYTSESSEIVISDDQSENVTLNADLSQILSDFGLLCTIQDAKTKANLSDVLVVMREVSSNKLFITDSTNVNGSIYKELSNAKINDQLSVQITISKPGYFTKVVEFNRTILSPGIIRVHEELDLSLEPIDKGVDLAKVFEIKPIYFDLNKSVIRPDAAAELDKIVAILNENPSLEIELGSHTDCRSSAAYNEWLSDERAKASAAYIKARISNPERITGKGYGESQLLNDCGCEDAVKSNCTEAQHQLNRRTEFKIVGFNGNKNPISKPAILAKPIAVADLIKKPIKINQNTTVFDKIEVNNPVNTSKANIPVDLRKPAKLIYPEGFVVGADLSKVLQIPMIYFDLDKYAIRPDAAVELDKIVAIMKQYPNMKIELTSHTDCRMPIDYNQRLSNNRAKFSKSYLVAHGIKSARIVAKGLGESQLAVDCPCEGDAQSACPEEQHQLNRRTEFIILSL